MLVCMKRQLSLALAEATGAPKVRKRRQVGRVLVPLGRRPSAARAGHGFVPHVTREAHSERCPVHVTMRRVALAPSFRSERVSNAIMFQLARASRAGSGIRVVQFSIQDDHLHLMLEGTDAQDLSRQAQKLFSRIALAVNAVALRRGSLFRDRHHRHELKTPTEVRRALVYILFNSRKHAGREGLLSRAGHATFDPLTSAPWFEGWAPRAGPSPTAAPYARACHEVVIGLARPTVNAQTWLAQTGYRRAGGPIRFDELPRIAR